MHDLIEMTKGVFWIAFVVTFLPIGLPWLLDSFSGGNQEQSKGRYNDWMEAQTLQRQAEEDSWREHFRTIGEMTD